MGAFLDIFKALKPWQVGVLVGVLLGAVGATYGVYTVVLSPGQQGLSEDQQVIPAQYGNLVNQVSTNGSLIFPNRATLTFGSPGTVEEILVAEGQQVVEGQPLAKLDSAAVNSLEKAVVQARLNLRNAEDTFAELMASYTTEDIAKAQSQVDLAKISLAIAERDLKQAQKGWDSKLQAAQQTVDTTRGSYPSVFSKWLGIDLSQDQANLDPDTLLASWEVDLTSLFDRSRRFVDIRLGSGPPLDDPATPWSEVIVYLWLNLYPGPIAPTCEDGVVPERGACIKKEMDDAWDAYLNAQDDLEGAQLQAAKAVATSENAIDRARDSLASAEQALADLQAGPDTLVVALREAEVASAQVALDTAIQRLEGATLKATMAGIVSMVNVEAGQSVGANTPVVEVVDPTVVEVDGIVDEIDVLFVSVGAKADVTMDALAGQVLQGTVSAIASAAQSQQGVVSYPIRIRVQAPEGVQLREGLSATASIVIREENNVLLVPIQALYGTFEQPVVRVMSNGSIEDRAVVLGNSDDFWVAVRQGLSEGEKVVVETQAATTSTGQGGLFGGMGGGMSLRQFQGQFPGALPGGGTFRGGAGTGQPRSGQTR